MMLTEAVFAQAALMTGQLDEQQTRLLNTLCQSSALGLEAQLRDGVTAQDCEEAFVAAASLYALAAFQDTALTGSISEFRAGDLTVKQKESLSSSQCLRQQADCMIHPFLKDRFAFLGV